MLLDGDVTEHDMADCPPVYGHHRDVALRRLGSVDDREIGEGGVAGNRLRALTEGYERSHRVARGGIGRGHGSALEGGTVDRLQEVRGGLGVDEQPGTARAGHSHVAIRDVLAAPYRQAMASRGAVDDRRFDG